MDKKKTTGPASGGKKRKGGVAEEPSPSQSSRRCVEAAPCVEEPIAPPPPLPPPVPAEPPAARGEAAMPRAHGPRGEAWPRWHVPIGGDLVLNEGTGSLSAHCHLHGGRCRIMRVLKCAPLGYLFAWLNQAGDYPAGEDGRQAHMELRHCLRSAACLDARSHARTTGLAQLSLSGVFDWEAEACGVAVPNVQEKDHW